MLHMLIQIPDGYENYPVATNADMVIIYSVKLALVIGFFYGMKYWVNKTTNSIPIYTSWILGVWFLFYQPFTLLHGTLLNLFVLFNVKMFETAGSLAVILAVIIYVKLGKTLTKR